MNTTVELVREDNVARVQFHTENGIQVFSAETRRALSGVIKELIAWDECRVAVFEAEGRVFIAGVDINELTTRDVESGEQIAREGQALMQQIAELPAVTIAAVHAACAGGGCELALACDLRMAAESARIGLPEVSLGIIPGWGGTVRATRLFGGAVARRMILCGDLLPADEALRLGIVDSVWPDEQFRDAVNARVEMILSRGPQACLRAKRLIADFESGDVASQLLAEAREFGACFATDEPAEGTRAFLEKRQPNW